MHYAVKSIRRSSGIDCSETSMNDESEARQFLADLADDDDFILAEIEAHDDNEQISRITVIAQSQRVLGIWQAIDGKLRTRSRGGEAREILQAANDAL